MSRPVVIVVLAQLLGTSLWFSANGAAPELARLWDIDIKDLGLLTSSVQLGFITGALLIGWTGMADRYAASRIFTISAVLGAVANLAMITLASGVYGAALFRFLTGLFLAGVYPMGMKMIVSWEKQRSGNALGWLVGMLIAGTASPHLIRAIGVDWSAVQIIGTSSALASMAAVMIFFLGDGPHLPPARKGLEATRLAVFKIRDFRASACGYFGHMWEIYAFWTIVPALLLPAVTTAGSSEGPLLSFAAFYVIAIGAVASFIGGHLSHSFGSAKVAASFLAISGIMCLLYPFLDQSDLMVMFVCFTFWGMAVSADSPQFSALSAKAAPEDQVGSALALQNAIGFFISIVSIWLTTQLYDQLGAKISWLLLPGPVLGLITMRHLLSRDPTLVESREKI